MKLPRATFVLAALVIALMPACKSKKTDRASEQEAAPNPTTPDVVTAPDKETAMNTPPNAPAPPIDSAAIATAATGLNEFSIALYKASAKDKNTVLSPFSVAAALSLLELGARGETAEELHQTLGQWSADRHRLGFRGLVHQITGDGQPIELHGTTIEPHSLRVANSLWIAKNYKIAAKFLDEAQGLYQAVARSIDVRDPDGAAAQVNDWVAKATKDKIKGIVTSQSITELTRMILVNAVHFVGRWQEPFMISGTKNRPFFLEGGQEVAVPTMLNGQFFPAVENDDVTIVELPYWSTNEVATITMTVIVPKAKDGLAAIEAKLTAPLLSEWISSLESKGRVSVYLPKWKAETATELSAVLESMGLRTLFSKDADLSGISQEEGLGVSGVLHKTFISVDEKGTEAAAATAIMMAGSAFSKPTEVHADRPFLYLIRDTKSGTILFLGRVVDPR